ncbi:MAG: hypothetical protein ACJA0N_000585 [Pseudohongiellaceae bacterium]|jgi:uncharacterized protein YjaG (DUF416 family)
MAASWQDISLCCALIERQLPNYALFSQISHFGDSQILRNGLEVVWASCAGHEQHVNFEKQLEKLEVITPELNNFDNFGVRPAVDCCVSLSMLFEVCADMQELDVATFTAVYLSTIQAYLELVENSEIDASYDHPLLSEAESFFTAVRGMLDDESLARDVRVKALKEFLKGINYSNIGIEYTL